MIALEDSRFQINFRHNYGTFKKIILIVGNKKKPNYKPKNLLLEKWRKRYWKLILTKVNPRL